MKKVQEEEHEEKERAPVNDKASSRMEVERRLPPRAGSMLGAQKKSWLRFEEVEVGASAASGAPSPSPPLPLLPPVFMLSWILQALESSSNKVMVKPRRTCEGA